MTPWCQFLIRKGARAGAAAGLTARQLLPSDTSPFDPLARRRAKAKRPKCRAATLDATRPRQATVRRHTLGEMGHVELVWAS